MRLLINLLDFVDMILGFYMWIVIAAAVITWVNPDPANPIVRFLRAVTEPVLWRIRRVIPTSFGGIDIAPMILIFAIIFVRHVLLSSLAGWLLT